MTAKVYDVFYRKQRFGFPYVLCGRKRLLFQNGIVTKFVGQFGNGANVLEVDDTDGLSVKLGAQTFTDARLTVFEDIDRSINVPLGFNGLQHVAIAFDNASKYVIWTGADSLAVVTKNDDLLTVVGGYYKSEGLESLKNKFCAGLDSSTDIYTTGGTGTYYGSV